MKVLAISPYNYRVFETDKGTYLEVVIGSLAMYELILKLTQEEIAEFNADTLFADRLSEKVRLNEQAYQSRRQRPPL